MENDVFRRFKKWRRTIALTNGRTDGHYLSERCAIASKNDFFLQKRAKSNGFTESSKESTVQGNRSFTYDFKLKANDKFCILGDPNGKFAFCWLFGAEIFW